MIELRDYQLESVDRLRANIRAGVKNQILAASTGAGKTVVAAHLLHEVNAKSRRAIFVADRIALIAQTSAVMEQYGIPHGVIQAQHERFRPWERIQVASAQTLARRGWPEADLIIVDEAHTVMKTVIDRIAPRDTLTIGLTATPFTRGLGKFYDSCVSVTTTNKLIADGFLVPPRFFAASEPDMSGAKVVAGEWTDDEAAKRSMPIIGDCVAEYLKHGDGKKFIAFGCNVAHCEEMQRQFQAAGVQCELYTYRTGDDARTQMVEEFRKPDSYIRGLISVAALSKGFDVPDVEVIILARPLRSSLSEHIQMLGRGLRIHPGKTECLVLDHAGNTLRFWGAMQEFFENGLSELDDGKPKPPKKAKAEESEAKACKCPSCAFVHNVGPSCPACGHVYPPKRSNIRQIEGELAEVGSARSSSEEKQAVYSQLLWIAHQRHYNSGWVAHKYRERFGVWPRGMIDNPHVASPELMNWVLSRQIAWAKSRRAA
jgi:type I site-specific restriction endonuclease